MALQITIDIFSGRPNPVLEISGKQAREILERVRPAKRLSRAAMPAPEFRLGYRGLIIQQKGAISRCRPSFAWQPARFMGSNVARASRDYANARETVAST